MENIYEGVCKYIYFLIKKKRLMQTCGEKNLIDKVNGQFGGQIVGRKLMEKLVEEMGKIL